MRFSLGMAFRNIRRRPARAVFMCMIVVFLSFALLTGGYLLISLQNGLEGYRARLGADIVVVPSSAQGHGTVDEILLQGITGNYYIPSAGLNKLESIEGIEEKTEQFYLTSAKASCCSARVQMIGFDPKTDFTVMPWISGSVDGNIGDGDILIGADIAYPADGYLRFYGDSYRVAGQLDRTGTGLDNAVFTNRSTIRKMADSAKVTLEREALKGIDPENDASCVLIRVKDGYDISAVADDINIHVAGVRATASGDLIASVSGGFRDDNGYGLCSYDEREKKGICSFAGRRSLKAYTCSHNGCRNSDRQHCGCGSWGACFSAAYVPDFGRDKLSALSSLYASRYRHRDPALGLCFGCSSCGE